MQSRLARRKFFQYTILDESTRKRILYFTNEHSMYETVRALLMTYQKIGCFHKGIQTDNGFKFTAKTLRLEKGFNIRNTVIY